MSQPQCARSADGYVFSWPDLPLTVSLSRIRESSRGTTAEMVVHHLGGTGKSKTLIHQSISLLTSKSRLANELNARHPAAWDSMLEQVCVMALREQRKGEPVESLLPTEDDHPSWFVLNPLLYEKNMTILYGPGDSLKSMLALYVGMLLASGQSGASLRCAPTPWRVLFLDWEMSARDLRGRVRLIQAGDPQLVNVPDYRRCAIPLADEIDAIRKLVIEGGYDIVLLDSLAMAAGGQELERADSAVRFSAALRALNCTSLVIGHTPKPQEEQKSRSLYGSVFFYNLCRVAWEVRREGDTIGCYQRKNNLGRTHPPFGLTIQMDESACRFADADLFTEPELAAELPLQDRAARALTEKPQQTLEQLAEQLNAKPSSLKTKLYKHKHRFISHEGRWSCVS